MDAHDVLWIIRHLLRPIVRPLRVNRLYRHTIRENPEITAVPRLLQILNESLELIEQTAVPTTLFCRYDTALSVAEQILEYSFVEEHLAYAETIRDQLLTEQDRIAIDFVDRCREKGNLWFVQEELFADNTVFSAEAKQYLSDVLQQLRSENPLTENGCYRYCSVAFTDHGKTYFYKTKDRTLSCGDEVLVPVGNSGKQSVGVIKSIQLFSAENAPYPPSVIKDIISRHA